MKSMKSLSCSVQSLPSLRGVLLHHTHSCVPHAPLQLSAVCAAASVSTSSKRHFNAAGLAHSMRKKARKFVPHSVAKMARNWVMDQIDLNKYRREFLTRKQRGSEESCTLQSELDALIEDKYKDFIETLSDTEKRTLQVLKLELEFLFYEGQNVLSPGLMRHRHWLELLTVTTLEDRMEYHDEQWHAHLTRHWQREQGCQSEQPECLHQTKAYPYGGFVDSNTSQIDHHNLAHGMRHGQMLVIDMDFTEQMNPQETQATATAVWEALEVNSRQTNPFHIHLRGCPPNQETYREMQLQQSSHQHLLATVSPQSYLDLPCAKGNICYLSPFAVEELTSNVSPHVVYVLGGYCDKKRKDAFCFAKARKHGVFTKKLPIDRHIEWFRRLRINRNLSLSYMIAILSTLNDTKSWPEALKHIPEDFVRKDPDSMHYSPLSAQKKYYVMPESALTLKKKAAEKELADERLVRKLEQRKLKNKSFVKKDNKKVLDLDKLLDTWEGPQKKDKSSKRR